jgi:hypothetical protein
MTMRFLCLYKPDDRKSAEAGVPPSPAALAEMGRFMEEMTKAGVLLVAEGLHASARGARIRLSGGQFTVTNGPFLAAKELVTGYAVIQTKTKEEAIEMTKRFLAVAGEGESEVRQLYEPQDFACQE